jgi:hypothetical protein
MAHGEDARRQVRAAYIYDQLTLEIAAVKGGVPYATARNWKRAGKDLGDDWDKARGAQMLAGGSIEDVVRQTLAVSIQQTQVTIEMIQNDPTISPVERVKMMASLSDSLNKQVATSRRLMPETDKLAVATDVVKRYAEFVRVKYPKHMLVVIETMEPFGDELARAYG